MTERGKFRLQWAELVATIGVLVSLVFVGFELRQSTAVARAQARNDLATLAQEWLLVLSQDSVANRAWRVYWFDREEGEPTATEANQTFYMMIALIRRLETTYFHHQEGLVPAAALTANGMQSPAFQGSRFRNEFWPRVRDQFDPDFVSWFEARLE